MNRWGAVTFFHFHFSASPLWFPLGISHSLRGVKEKHPISSSYLLIIIKIKLHVNRQGRQEPNCSSNLAYVDTNTWVSSSDSAHSSQASSESNLWCLCSNCINADATIFSCHGFCPTFVILVCCAPASNKIRIVWMCPSRAEMCNGVWPAVVAESGLALCSRRSLTSSLWPMRAAQCKGVWSSCTQREKG